jgi:hypothetical protein
MAMAAVGLVVVVVAACVAAALYVEQGACGGAPAPGPQTPQGEVCDAILSSDTTRIIVYATPALIALLGGGGAVLTASKGWFRATTLLALAWLVALVLLNVVVPDS